MIDDYVIISQKTNRFHHNMNHGNRAEIRSRYTQPHDDPFIKRYDYQAKKEKEYECLPLLEGAGTGDSNRASANDGNPATDMASIAAIRKPLVAPIVGTQVTTVNVLYRSHGWYL